MKNEDCVMKIFGGKIFGRKNIWEEKYLGEITYLGERATLSNLTLFGCWFHVEGVSDFCFSNL
jgi:hypothetical protein